MYLEFYEKHNLNSNLSRFEEYDDVINEQFMDLGYKKCTCSCCLEYNRDIKILENEDPADHEESHYNLLVQSRQLEEISEVVNPE